MNKDEGHEQYGDNLFMSKDMKREWQELSESEKEFVKGQIRQQAHEFAKQLHRVHNGGRCSDCGELFEESGPNRQSDLSPSLCVVCDEYKNGDM
jgi:formylmethanofuran dehydrogenase subunit E